MEHHAVIAEMTAAVDRGEHGWVVLVVLAVCFAAWAFWCWHIERRPPWRVFGYDELGRPQFAKAEKPDTRLLQFPDCLAGM